MIRSKNLLKKLIKHKKIDPFEVEAAYSISNIDL